MDVMDNKTNVKVIGAVDIDAAIEEAERDLANGVEPIPADEVFAFLRREFFDEV